MYCGKKPANHGSTSVWLFFMDPDRVIRFEQSWIVSSAKLNDVSLYQQAIPSQIRTCQIWKWNSIVVNIYRMSVFFHFLTMTYVCTLLKHDWNRRFWINKYWTDWISNHLKNKEFALLTTNLKREPYKILRSRKGHVEKCNAI